MSEGDVGGLWTWLAASLTLRLLLRTSGSLQRTVSMSTFEFAVLSVVVSLDKEVAALTASQEDRYQTTTMEAGHPQHIRNTGLRLLASL